MSLTMTANRHPSPDEALLAQKAVADTDAFAELYRRHVTRVYRYHLAHTGNVADAEDLTSQTFLAALEGIRSYRAEGSFAAWIMGIASKKRALFFRARKPEVSLDASVHHPTPGLLPDQAAFARLESDSVLHALRQISPKRAEALILRFFAGLTYAEAAVVLHKREAAVKMLVARGLQDLRERTSLTLEMER